MVGFNLNIGSSVFKRELKSLTEVTNQLQRNGWERTGSIGEGVVYMENAGLSVTVVDAPLATLIFPSGPVRGRVFGESGLQANTTSVIGAGADSADDMTKQDQEAMRKVDQIT